MKTFTRIVVAFCTLTVSVSLACAAVTVAWVFLKIARMLPGGIQ